VLDGATLSWLLPDIVIRRKSGTAAIAQFAPTAKRPVPEGIAIG
jgi:hypothetical protein